MSSSVLHVLKDQVALALSLFIATTAAGDSPRPADVPVQFRLSAVEGAASLTGTLTLRPAHETGVAQVVKISSGEPTTIQLPSDSVWIAETRVPGWWAPAESLAVTPGLPPRDVRVWPSGRIAGIFALTDVKEKLPRMLNVKLTDPPATPTSKRGPAGATIECSIDENGHWECDIPALPLDLAVRADGFIPQYRWAVPIPQGKTKNLGTMTFKRGASIVGWAQPEKGKINPETAQARLFRMVAPGATTALAERLRLPVFSVPLRESGFFQLAGVEPGSYTIEIAQPDLGSGRFYPVEVYAGAETRLKSVIRLRPPLRLELAIEPPIDPLGQPWHVRLFRQADYSNSSDDLVYDADVGTDGAVAIPNQTAGHFWLDVFDSSANPLHADDLVVADESDAHRTIRISVTTVHGTLRLGTKALQASLWFGGRHGARHGKTRSDDEGKFVVMLPKDGWWPVEIESDSPRINTRTEVTIDSDADGETKADITLPDNRIEGIVVDSSGKPVAGALVRLATLRDILLESSADNGRFAFHSVPAGQARIAAEKGQQNSKLSSSGFFFTVSENANYGPIELRLERSRTVSGIVRSPRGGIAGAEVTITPLGADLMTVYAATTELDGSFRVDVSDVATSAIALVKPPGYALRAYDLPLDGRSAVFDVSADGGTLELILPEPDPNPENFRSYMVWQNGRMLSMTHLGRWARGHGVQWSPPTVRMIPNVAAAAYRLCEGPLAMVSEREAQSWYQKLRCVDGILAPGGNLRLDLSAK